VKTKQLLRLVFGAWIASATFVMLGCDESKPADATKKDAPANPGPKADEKKPDDKKAP
jgi:hypothetical protein